MGRLRRFLHIEQSRTERPAGRPEPPLRTPPSRGEPPPPLTPRQSEWVREQLQRDWEGSLLARLDDGVERLADAILRWVPSGARTGVRYAALTAAGALLLLGIFGGRSFGPRVLCLIGAVALGFVFGPSSLRRPRPGGD